MKKLLTLILLSLVTVTMGVNIDKPSIGKQVKASEKIIAAYFFNEKAGDIAIDYSTRKHTGTLIPNNAISDMRIIDSFGYSVSFDGAGDYITIPDHDDFTPALTPFSISTWVYMHTATYFVWASKWQVASNREWNMYTGTPKKINFRVYDDSENASIGRLYNTSLASYENQWTHFVATYDGGILSSGIKIYLNGNRVDDTDSESGSFISVENLIAPVYIGRYDTKYTNGLIDNVTFFNKELTSKEVQRLFRDRYHIVRD